jgi:hypothetical protein
MIRSVGIAVSETPSIRTGRGAAVVGLVVGSAVATGSGATAPEVVEVGRIKFGVIEPGGLAACVVLQPATRAVASSAHAFTGHLFTGHRPPDHGTAAPEPSAVASSSTGALTSAVVRAIDRDAIGDLGEYGA